MRTTLNLDEQTITEVMSLTGQTNRSEAVRLALHAYIHEHRKQRLLSMRGTLNIQNNWAFLRGLENDQ